MEADKIINWTKLSEYLTETGNKGSIRREDIPQKYIEDVNLLQFYIKCWLNTEELLTEKEVRDKINDKVKEQVEELEQEVKEFLLKIHKLAENPII